MRICDKCGYENPDDAKFCIECGRELVNDSNIICPKCGAKNTSDSAFCYNCGMQLEKKVEVIDVRVDTPKEKMSPLAVACLVLSIIGATFTLIAINELLALAGITISTVSLVMLAIGLLIKKVKGNVRFAFGLGIYGIIGNTLWLFFLMWMLPNF